MPSLAEMIGSPGGESVTLRQAIVTAVPSAGTCQIRLGGSTTDISGVKVLASAAVANGDTVWVMQQGYILIVIGPINRAQANWYGGTEFGEGLELFHPNGTPYIDWHNSAAGVGTADYITRMLMLTTGTISLNIAGTYTYYWYPDGEFDCHHIGVNGDNAKNVGAFLNSGTGVGLYFDNSLSDNKILLWDPDYSIGIRGSTLYMRSGGTKFQWETPPGSWAMLYGPAEVNTVERGLNVLGNLQSGEVYAGGWFRNLNGGMGWYNNVGAAGWMAYATRTIETQNLDTLVLIKNSNNTPSDPILWLTAPNDHIPYLAMDEYTDSAIFMRKDQNNWNIVFGRYQGDATTCYAAGWGTWSDPQMKTDVEEHGYGLAHIQQLNTHRFKYKAVKEEDIYSQERYRWEQQTQGRWGALHGNPKHAGWEEDAPTLGFMADQMHGLIPEATGYNGQGEPMGVLFDKIVVVLVEAVKELAERIEALEASQ